MYSYPLFDLAGVLFKKTIFLQDRTEVQSLDGVLYVIEHLFLQAGAFTVRGERVLYGARVLFQKQPGVDLPAVQGVGVHDGVEACG